jgi:hypothetical protein
MRSKRPPVTATVLAVPGVALDVSDTEEEMR